MPVNLRNRHFLKLLDFTPSEIQYLLDLSHSLKTAKRTGTEQPRLRGPGRDPRSEAVLVKTRAREVAMVSASMEVLTACVPRRKALPVDRWASVQSMPLHAG